jgi:NAD(P)-dependent dehydrogenase (short-subunit alcohol dehydrogenase family)
LESLRNGLRKGKSLLPDVVDTMDPSQILALDLAGRLFDLLPGGWDLKGERFGVVLYMPGKTGAIVRANDRVLIARMGRLVESWGGRLDQGEALRRLDAETPTGPYTLTGGMPNVASARVCQAYNLKGPNLVVAHCGRGSDAARFYAQSLVADGTCEAVVLLEIEPHCNSWLPHRYRASASLLVDSVRATASGWPGVAAPTEVSRNQTSTTRVEASPTIGFYGVDLTPWDDFLPAVATSSRILLLPDERARKRMSARKLPDAWRLADPNERSEIPQDRYECAALISDLGEESNDHLGEPDDWRRILEPLLTVSRLNYGAIASGRLKLAHVSLRAFCDRLPHPLSGLAGGFMKSLGRETPGGKAAAVVCDDDDLSAALSVASGLWRIDGQTWEAFRRNGVVHRQVLTKTSNPSDSSGSGVSRGDLALVTGGARGITAELVAMLLERFACRVMILGRSNPDDVPQERRMLDADAFAAKLPDFLLGQTSQGVNLKAARATFERLQAAHEALLSLKRFRSLPGLVEYHRCDATDLDRVRVCLKAIQSSHGPIRFVLHGAGVQTSGRLDRKDPAVFWRIIDTKLGGLRAILRALEESGGPAPHVHIATSAFSYFGNDGQEDYGAANETLNRLADVRRGQAGSSGPCWTTMAWLAWDGIGMTKGSEYRVLAKERGMRAITGSEGGALLGRLLAGRPRRGANILMSENERERYQIAIAPARIEEWRLDDPNEAWLSDHMVNGRPVYPACVIVARMVAAAQSLRPETPAVAVENCLFERPLAARIASARVCVLKARDCDSSVDVWIEADLRSPGGNGRRFASCRVSFEVGKRLQSVKQPRASSTDSCDIHDPYCHPDSTVRLGGSFDCLDEIRISPSTNSAVLRVPVDRPMQLWDGLPVPIVVDALLRVGSLHQEGESLPIYVPAGIDRIAWDVRGCKSATNVSFALVSERPAAQGERMRCSHAVACDESGRTVLEMHGYAGARVGRMSMLAVHGAVVAR